jgi:hypothetical protein
MLDRAQQFLTEAFVQYLRSGPDNSAAIAALIEAFQERGFLLEAQVLRHLMAGHAESRPIDQGPWAGKSVLLSPEAPQDAPAGALWFDIADLTPMLFVPHPEFPSPKRNRWVAIHPVYVWQYRGFLSLVRVLRKRIEFPAAADYFEDRFTDQPEISYLGSVYQDEALAYAYSFGKALADQLDWRFAHDMLPSAQFNELLPPERLAWEESEYPFSEFARSAVGQETLYKLVQSEEPSRVDGTNVNLPDRMVFEEWERMEKIGFSTLVEADRGRALQSNPKTLFFELINPIAATFGAQVAQRDAPSQTS